MKRCPVCGEADQACGGPAESTLSVVRARPEQADQGPLDLYRVGDVTMRLSAFDAHRVNAVRVNMPADEPEPDAPKRRGRPPKGE